MPRLSLMTMNMFIPAIIKIKMERDMEDALELYGEMLDLAADAGFEAVDVTSMELDMIGKETVKEYLEARGLKVSSLIYSNQFASTDEEKCREIVEGGKNAVEQAIYLETKVLMLVPQVHEGIEQFSAEEVQRALIGNLTPGDSLCCRERDTQRDRGHAGSEAAPVQGGGSGQSGGRHSGPGSGL